METSLGVVLAYLLGSVPFGLLVSQAVAGKDPRNVGSGNIGATNVLRSSGPAAALITLAGDGLKGWAAPWAATQLGLGQWESCAMALGAFLGHLFPLYLRFKGGKGVATGAGILAAVAPIALAECAALFFLGVILTRFVSVGSLLAAVGAPVAVFLLRGTGPDFYLAILLGSGVIWRHAENLRRLATGNEQRLGGPRRG